MADRIFRRDKRNPRDDFWHVLRVGAVICFLIFITVSAMGANL